MDEPAIQTLDEDEAATEELDESIAVDRRRQLQRRQQQQQRRQRQRYRRQKQHRKIKLAMPIRRSSSWRWCAGARSACRWRLQQRSQELRSMPRHSMHRLAKYVFIKNKKQNKTLCTGWRRRRDKANEVDDEICRFSFCRAGASCCCDQEACEEEASQEGSRRGGWAAVDWGGPGWAREVEFSFFCVFDS